MDGAHGRGGSPSTTPTLEQQILTVNWAEESWIFLAEAMRYGESLSTVWPLILISVEFWRRHVGDRDGVDAVFVSEIIHAAGSTDISHSFLLERSPRGSWVWELDSHVSRTELSARKKFQGYAVNTSRSEVCKAGGL